MADFVGHFLIFTCVAIGALIVPLLIGRLIRPKLPTPEKDAIYECGEPTIGSSYIQFDLRFYVVAMLFIIFDVEVAFFFPWATIYGGAMQLADTRIAEDSATREILSAKLLNLDPKSQEAAANVISSETAMSLGATGLVDILVFFSVLLVGFMYVWKRGDLDWIRAVANKPKIARAPVVTAVAPTKATTAQTAS
ncbi:MAG: NADH-quinone oxidoreductase subunit A [Planctomycetaceae bacterium]